MFLGHYFVLIVSPQWWYQLFSDGAKDSHLLKHNFQLFFSYSDVMMTPGFDQKVEKSFAAYLYPHLTHLTTWQGGGSKFSWLSKSSTSQGSNSWMQGNLVLFKMNRLWNGLCCWRDSKVWRKIEELKVLQSGYRYICLYLRLRYTGQLVFQYCWPTETLSTKYASHLVFPEFLTSRTSMLNDLCWSFNISVFIDWLPVMQTMHK